MKIVYIDTTDYRNEYKRKRKMKKKKIIQVNKIVSKVFNTFVMIFLIYLSFHEYSSIYEFSIKRKKIKGLDRKIFL